MRSIDVSLNGTNPNIGNGNVWTHVIIAQPQHYELDAPKVRSIGHVFPSNLCHDPASYCDAMHQGDKDPEEWVVHIQIIVAPY